MVVVALLLGSAVWRRCWRRAAFAVRRKQSMQRRDKRCCKTVRRDVCFRSLSPSLSSWLEKYPSFTFHRPAMDKAQKRLGAQPGSLLASCEGTSMPGEAKQLRHGLLLRCDVCAAELSSLTP